MKLYIDYILTLYISSNLVMQPVQELDQDLSPYDALCFAGLPPHKVVSILAEVNSISLCDQVNCPGIDNLTKNVVNLCTDFPKIGEALLSMATNSHMHSDTDTRHKTVILLLLAVMCLEPNALTTICEFLCSCNMIEIAEALRDNSLHKLSHALAMFDPRNFEYNIQLVIAFLGHYPDAFCAQLPNTPPARMYTLIRALGCALDNGLISITVLVVGDEGRILSLRDLAQLLLEGLVQKKDD